MAGSSGKADSVVHDMAPLIVDSISYRFKGLVAVESCSLVVKAGQITGLIGPNGAGKSTVVNMISGSLRPSRGSITFLGSRVDRWPSHKLGAKGLIRTFQVPAEFGSLTTLENLLIGVRGHAGEHLTEAVFARKSWQTKDAEYVDRACEILQRIGLYAKRNDLASTLSGGQRRLVELGRVMMSEPKVLLLDEPMFGLSPVVSETISDLLRELANTGVAILLVEHLLKAVEALCQDVCVLVAGSVVATGPYAEVMATQEVRDAYLGSIAAHGNAVGMANPGSAGDVG
jgi:branched-chain amino acid transport system ATP-binding protein